MLNTDSIRKLAPASVARAFSRARRVRGRFARSRKSARITGNVRTTLTALARRFTPLFVQRRAERASALATQLLFHKTESASPVAETATAPASSVQTEAERLDCKLDEALELTFPASDPVAIGSCAHPC